MAIRIFSSQHLLKPQLSESCLLHLSLLLVILKVQDSSWTWVSVTFLENDAGAEEICTDSWDICVAEGKTTPKERSAYRECKTQGEFQAWKWVEKNHPGFEFNTVLPWFTVSLGTINMISGANNPY